MSNQRRVCGSHRALLVSLAAAAVTFGSSARSTGLQSGNVAADRRKMESCLKALGRL